jgi:hypothetical protein
MRGDPSIRTVCGDFFVFVPLNSNRPTDGVEGADAPEEFPIVWTLSTLGVVIFVALI